MTLTLDCHGNVASDIPHIVAPAFLTFPYSIGKEKRIEIVSEVFGAFMSGEHSDLLRGRWRSFSGKEVLNIDVNLVKG